MCTQTSEGGVTGAGARRTRVDWEQVEDTRILPCTRWGLLPPHTSLRQKKSTDCLHSIASNRHEPMNSAREIDVFIAKLILIIEQKEL